MMDVDPSPIPSWFDVALKYVVYPVIGLLATWVVKWVKRVDESLQKQGRKISKLGRTARTLGETAASDRKKLDDCLTLAIATNDKLPKLTEEVKGLGVKIGSLEERMSRNLENGQAR